MLIVESLKLRLPFYFRLVQRTRTNLVAFDHTSSIAGCSDLVYYCSIRLRLMQGEKRSA